LVVSDGWSIVARELAASSRSALHYAAAEGRAAEALTLVRAGVDGRAARLDRSFVAFRKRIPPPGHTRPTMDSGTRPETVMITAAGAGVGHRTHALIAHSSWPNFGGSSCLHSALLVVA
jgi:hypothetical protein